MPYSSEIGSFVKLFRAPVVVLVAQVRPRSLRAGLTFAVQSHSVALSGYRLQSNQIELGAKKFQAVRRELVYNAASRWKGARPALCLQAILWYLQIAKP